MGFKCGYTGVLEDLNKTATPKTVSRTGWTHFESVEEFMDAINADAKEISRTHAMQGGKSWVGDTWDGAVEKAINGDLSSVDKANAIIDEIDAQIDVSGLRASWGDAVVGAYANVPAYLAGSPESMRAMVPQASPKGPVTIWYSPVCSAVISAEDAYKRGMAVLALVLAMQRVRPVMVKIVTAYGVADHTIAIRTEPMVLAEAAHCLTAVSFYRGLSYGLALSKGWTGDWAGWYSRNGSSEARIDAEFRKQVNAEPDDLIVPPMDSTHGMHAEMINTPAAWINKVLDQYRNK